MGEWENRRSCQGEPIKGKNSINGVKCYKEEQDQYLNKILYILLLFIHLFIYFGIDGETWKKVWGWEEKLREGGREKKKEQSEEEGEEKGAGRKKGRWKDGWRVGRRGSVRSLIVEFGGASGE